MYVYKHLFQNKNFMMPAHFCISYHLRFEQNIDITFMWGHLCRTFRVHCVKIVQMQTLFWSVFSDKPHKSTSSVRMQENADQKKLYIWTLFT